MKQAIRYTQVFATSCILVLFPMVMGQSCRSAQLSPEGQARMDSLMAQYEQAVLEGDEDRAADLEDEMSREQDAANAEQAQGWVDFALGFIPAPEHLKKPMAASLGVLGAQLCFERPRSRWKDAVKALGRSVKEANPVGDRPNPSMAGKEMLEAARSVAAVFGLKHTTDDPDKVIENGKKLKAKKAATAPSEVAL